MRIYLRALELGDYEITSKWRNDQELTNFLGGNFFYVSSERERKWVENEIMNDSNSVRLGIVVKDTAKLIGLVNLTNIDWINRKAEFSIMIGEKENWGIGFGAEATLEMLKFGFNQRNLNRIYLTVDVTHNKAISLYEKLGFTREGTLRDHHFKNGEYKNVFIYSILKNES